VRLGSAEESILFELRRSGGPVPRQRLVKLVQETAASSRRSPQPVSDEIRGIKNAESTLSRALRSLERKKLISRTYSRATRQTLVSLADAPAPPLWELEAQREEAFASRCDTAATELIQLARRARRRASRLRMERSTTATSREREVDRARWRHLLSP
jgi:DNA-binding MarR family transcriptional regulator